jgi:hypothetical protein
MTGWIDTTLQLQIEAFGRDPRTLDGAERADWIRMNALAAIKEIGESLDETRWKPWAVRVGEVVNRELFITEIVDAMHFLANLLATVGCTDEEFAQRYGTKVQVNYERQARPEGYDDVANRTEGRAVDDVAAALPVPPDATPVAPAQPLGDFPTEPTAPTAPQEASHVPPGASATDPVSSTAPASSAPQDASGLRAILETHGAAQISVAGLDAEAAKKAKEEFYKVARDMGRKISVRTDKTTGIATGTLRDEEPAAENGQASAPVAPPAAQPASPLHEQPQPAAAPPAPAPVAAPVATAPAPVAAAPQQAAASPGNPMTGQEHVDRFGRGWRYGATGWERAADLDAQPMVQP